MLVLAGGGTEGDLTDMRAWSARLYRHLLDGGDVTGDGLVQVLVLSTAEESDWIPTYLVQLGADAAENLRVASRAAADDAALTERFAACDAVFLKGGDQGRYYDLWNDTLLEELILEVHGRGGGVGGTSAGAMSLSGYALAGGMDYVSADVLVDSHTPYLDDASDGGPGVHDDFLGLWPGALVDTHFTERGRLGRLAGAMALALDEGAPLSLLGVGIEQSTGVVVRGGEAEVIGDGTVTLLRPSEPAVRTPGQGLLWRGVALDRLPQGWTFDAATGDLGETPAGAIAVSPTRLTAALAEPWQADGGDRTHEQRFGWAASAAPFSVDPGSDPPLLTGAIGQLNAHDRDRRALAHELLYAALGEHPGAAGLLVGAGARLEVEGATLRSTLDPDAEGPQPSTLILDTAGVRAVHRGATPSPYAPSSSGLFPVGLIGAQLHVIGHSESSGWTWDLASGQAEAM
ncbi:MAG: cyanophycinase [Alphaproteobacteria bacterium]|nr:cyanophycinase [Alphaproteobacteria bacterium]